VQDDLDRITRQQTEGITDDFEVEFIDAKEIEKEENEKLVAAQKAKLKAKVSLKGSVPSTPVPSTPFTPVPESPRPTTPGAPLLAAATPRRDAGDDMMDIVKPEDVSTPVTPAPRLLLSISRNKVASLGSAPATPAPPLTPGSIGDSFSRPATPAAPSTPFVAQQAAPALPMDFVPSTPPPAPFTPQYSMPAATAPTLNPVPLPSATSFAGLAPQPVRSLPVNPMPAPVLPEFTPEPDLQQERTVQGSCSLNLALLSASSPLMFLPWIDIETSPEYIQLMSQLGRAKAEVESTQKQYEELERRLAREVNQIMKVCTLVVLVLHASIAS
jgi:hypothetical protein